MKSALRSHGRWKEIDKKFPRPVMKGRHLSKKEFPTKQSPSVVAEDEMKEKNSTTRHRGPTLNKGSG